MQKTSLSRKVFMFFNTLFLAGFALACLYPLMYVLFASFSESTKLLSHEGVLLKPLGFNLDAYRAVVDNPSIISGYVNSIIVLVVGTFFSVSMTALGAFFWSRKNVGLKKVIEMMFIITMFFNGGLIPTYMVVKGLGLYNTLASLFVPTLIATYNMVIMRTAFQSVPNSLEEAAVLDGANDFQIMIKVSLPLTKATIAVMVLYYGVGYWNSWFNAMIYLKDRVKYPLQLVLKEILIVNDMGTMAGGSDNAFNIAESIKYATIVVAIVPILCIYPFLQKYFAKGVMVGAIKG